MILIKLFIFWDRRINVIIMSAQRFEWTRERRTRVQQRYAKFYTFVQTAQPDKVSGSAALMQAGKRGYGRV